MKGERRAYFSGWIASILAEELTRLYVQQNATSRQEDDKTTVITMC